MKRLTGFVLSAALLLGGPAPAARADIVLHPPVPGPVVRPFDPPALRWLAGHRGVDLAGRLDQPVRSAAAGVITFAGELAGREVVVVSHGALRTTYEPVHPAVGVGAEVRAGDVIGQLRDGHRCPAPVCLHWGLKRGERYLNPLAFLPGEVVLQPSDEAPPAVSAPARVGTATSFGSRRLRPGGAPV